ncbi:nucleoside deaminase [Lactococcus nasutitermitis]|uniref:tRNA-specific adenosine deaminase n=1 Tax=Lactococcus nasutitermitis TaxID=1652957 RepID=A0ABV9JB10_9LACT|nr:nucleoside deaminase [Lactococcus nasutitermitis]
MEFTEEEKTFFMREALLEAQKAAANEEVPIGAVIVQVPQRKATSGLFERIPDEKPQIIARAFNRRELDGQAIHHAEICAIEMANEAVGNWRLLDCALFVTIEPCVMCAGAIGLARIPAVYFGATNPKFGGTVSLYQILQDERLNHRVRVESGILEKECAEIMQDFFRNRRKKLKNRD